jgi:hypothetical protein
MIKLFWHTDGIGMLPRLRNDVDYVKYRLQINRDLFIKYLQKMDDELLMFQIVERNTNIKIERQMNKILYKAAREKRERDRQKKYQEELEAEKKKLDATK